MREDNKTLVKIFTERMRQLRLEKGKKENREITQVTVSKELGIHVNTIRSYESNSLNQLPKIEQLMKIKNYYNVSYEYLLGETDIKNSNLDIQKICEETGLNEQAIQNLAVLKNDNEFIFILNNLILSKAEFNSKKDEVIK